MPAFDLKLVNTAEDLPDLLLAFDMTTARGDATPAGGPITDVKNRAPGSLRALAGGDQFIAPWWNAHGTGGVPYDASAFSGLGGIGFTGAGQALTVFGTEAPAKPVGSFTICVVTKLTSSGHGQVYYDAGGLVQMNVSDTNFTNHLTYGHAGGVVDTGLSPGLTGTNVDVLTLDAGINSAKWYRNGSLTPIFTGGYTPSSFGGGNITMGDSGVATRYMDGALGRLLVYNRLLSKAEISLIFQLEGARLGSPMFIGTYQFLPTELGTFIDPETGGVPSRINAVSGHPEQYYRVRRGPYAFVDVLAIATVANGQVGGTFDSAGNYFPHFVEWPFMATSGEPPIFQNPTDPSGVCRLRLRDTGRYIIAFYQPGGGMRWIHFNLEP